jgi:hypothetical protein
MAWSALRIHPAHLGLICVSLILSAAPRAVLGDAAPVAPPAGGEPPVTINSCGPIINKNSSQTSTIAGIPVPIPASSSSGIAIEFVNESNQTATLVNFAVDSAGDNFVIRDVGTFTPGVSIKHQYRNGAGQAFILPAFISPNVTCHVASVEFADGSVWRRGQPAAPAPTVAPAAASSAALNATPARLNMEGASDSQLFLVSSSARVAAFKETDDCGKVATIFVAATGDSSATYSVKPIAAGTCTARVTDEAGNAVTVPIVIQ